MPIGSRWIFESKEAFYAAAQNYYGNDWKNNVQTNFFVIQPHFGIGFPF
jgi:hypothetical protein